VFQVGEIISRFEKKGFYLKGNFFLTVDPYNMSCDSYGLAATCVMVSNI
jgi:nucleoside diphosphate kinase